LQKVIKTISSGYPPVSGACSVNTDIRKISIGYHKGKRSEPLGARRRRRSWGVRSPPQWPITTTMWHNAPHLSAICGRGVTHTRDRTQSCGMSIIMPPLGVNDMNRVVLTYDKCGPLPMISSHRCLHPSPMQSSQAHTTTKTRTAALIRHSYDECGPLPMISPSTMSVVHCP
jgi:hypothetical protein